MSSGSDFPGKWIVLKPSFDHGTHEEIGLLSHHSPPKNDCQCISMHINVLYTYTYFVDIYLYMYTCTYIYSDIHVCIFTYVYKCGYVLFLIGVDVWDRCVGTYGVSSSTCISDVQTS